MSRAGRRVIQPFDVMDVFHVSLHELAPGFDIVLVEFPFRHGFFEMLTQAVLHFFGKELHDRVEVASMARVVNGTFRFMFFIV